MKLLLYILKRTRISYGWRYFAIYTKGFPLFGSKTDTSPGAYPGKTGIRSPVFDFHVAFPWSKYYKWLDVYLWTWKHRTILWIHNFNGKWKWL